jgi:hypothetical protein
VEIDGYLEDVRIDGVDIGPLIEAELDRRDPDRVLVRPTDADGFRRAWDIVVGRWDTAVEQARELPEDLLHQRVDGEWSFVETLRHLVFATDAWVLRAVLGHPAPYHRLGLAHTELAAGTPAVPHAPDARPSLQEILAVRRDRMSTVAGVLMELTDERLEEMTQPVLEPGYPASESFRVRRCLGSVVNEEWLHREFAERDLACHVGRVPSASASGSPRCRHAGRRRRPLYLYTGVAGLRRIQGAIDPAADHDGVDGCRSVALVRATCNRRSRVIAASASA